MTIFEIADQLPNGFHDSEVESIRIDYVSRTLELAVDVFVGGPDDPPETREAYRKALVWIRDLQYCVIDPPDERYPFSASHALTIDVAEPTLFVPMQALFGCRVWVAEWNAFFHVAAGSAEFAWAGAPTYRRS